MTRDRRIRVPHQRPRDADRHISAAEWRGWAGVYGSGGDEMPEHTRAQDLREWVEHKGQERAPRVEREAAEQHELAVEAQRRWWGLGFFHHAQESGGYGAIRGKRMQVRGVRGGVQDVEVLVPERRIIVQATLGGEYGTFLEPPVLLAVELKSPAARPSAAIRETLGEWWLSWRPEGTATDPEGDRRTHYGLKGAQAKRLRLLHAVGFRTFVAYSAQEALEWIEQRVGPEPVEIEWP